MATLRQWLPATVLLAGTVLLLQGLWIPVKAAVAQHLLERKFQQILAGGRHAPPWPWADGKPLARISWPAGNISQVVFGHASGRTLAFAPGHVPPSALPGSIGHVVISAHRDTHFAFLGELEPGDRLLLEFPGGRQHFRVIDREILDLSRQHFTLSPESHRLSLVTCYPLQGLRAGTSRRLVVHLDPVAT